MNTIEKIRFQFYVPFKSIVGYEELIDNLVVLFCGLFEGCTIIDKVDGYYQPRGSYDIYPDIINIFIIDVPPRMLENTDKFCRAVCAFINNKLGEDYIYFSIGGGDWLFPSGK